MALLHWRVAWPVNIPWMETAGNAAPGAAFRRWLEATGVPNIENVNKAIKPASPWFSFYGAKSADELG